MSEGRAEEGRGPEPPGAANGLEEPGPEPSAGRTAGEDAAVSGAEGQGGEGLRAPEDATPPPVSSIVEGEGPPGASAPKMIWTMGGRPLVDPAAVLLAVERVGADVAALGRALAAQPEEVAARLDVDAATASLGVRIGALGSALDQLRLSLLAGLDRAAEHADAPPWLDDLQASLRDLGARVDAPPWLAGLHANLVGLKPLVAEQQRALRDAVTQLAVLELSLATAPGNEPVLNAIAKLASDDRMRELTTTVERVADDGQNLNERLGRVEQAIADLADGVRAGGAIADVLDHLGQRLVAIEAAAARVANDASTLVEQVVPIPDRLSAIASQVDRITPLARAGDQAGTLFDQLDGVAARLDEVIARLRPATGGDMGRDDEHDHDDDQDLDERLEAVVDVLAGVTRRQDQVTEAADAVLERVARQERSMASHLDWVGERLAEVAAHLVPDARGGDSASEAAGERLVEIAQALAAVAHRQENLAALVESSSERLDRRLSGVEGALAEVQRGTFPVPGPAGSPSADATALRLAELRAQRAEVQARLQEERLLAAQFWDDDR